MEDDRVIASDGKTLTDQKGEVVGWISDNGKFYPSGAPLSMEQIGAISKILSCGV